MSRLGFVSVFGLHGSRVRPFSCSIEFGLASGGRGRCRYGSFPISKTSTSLPLALYRSPSPLSISISPSNNISNKRTVPGLATPPSSFPYLALYTLRYVCNHTIYIHPPRPHPKTNPTKKPEAPKCSLSHLVVRLVTL